TLFRGFQAILYKEFLVVLRDPLTLFFMFFPPLVEMIAFGYALDVDVKHMATVVLDEDRTVESRALVDQFVNTQTFRVVGEVRSVAELGEAIRRGRAYVGLQIPPGFTRDLRAGRTARVQVLIDGSNSTIASSSLNTALNVGFRGALLVLSERTGLRDLPVEVRPQILYNPEMRSPNFFVPGVIGIVLQIATTFATAMALVRERERGTIEQLLVSPMSRWGLMLGKLVPYLVIGMVMAVTLFAIMEVLFHVPIAGDLKGLIVATFLYAFALLSLGLLISTRAQNQIQALQMTMIFILPSVFFSGFIFPRETMPWIFYTIGSVLPATYYIELERAIVLRGASLADFWFNIVVLAAMGLGLFSLCALRFKQKIA
ncbi:MAG: ABC transporter ATP-binding protein, partial [Verrucomicrobia bacterium]